MDFQMKTCYGDAAPKIFTSLSLEMKHFLFNAESRKKNGRFVSFYKTVLEMKKLHQIHAIRTHCPEHSRTCS